MGKHMTLLLNGLRINTGSTPQKNGSQLLEDRGKGGEVELGFA